MNDIDEQLNYYQILGIDDVTVERDVIKQKWHSLSKLYHPDKNKTVDPQLFELVNQAWNVLGNKEKRKIYDIKFKKKKNSNISNLRQQFEDYKKLSENIPQDEELFKKKYDEFDNMMKIDRELYEKSLQKKNDISENDTDDLLFQRKNDEIEFSQEKLFEDEKNIDLGKFNAIFDLKNNKKSDTLIKQTTFSGFDFDVDYSNTIENDIKSDFNGDQRCSNFTDVFEIEQSSIVNIDNIAPSTYTKDYKSDKDKYADEIEKRIKEREKETKDLNINYSEFKNYKVNLLMSEADLDNYISDSSNF